MAWTDETYEAFNKFSEARSEFMHQTRTGAVREAFDVGDIELVVRAWDELGTAVGVFFDHLTDKCPHQPGKEIDGS